MGLVEREVVKKTNKLEFKTRDNYSLMCIAVHRGTPSILALRVFLVWVTLRLSFKVPRTLL